MGVGGAVWGAGAPAEAEIEASIERAKAANYHT
jgi:hypothetical protein